jgi:hypothetical protein
MLREKIYRKIDIAGWTAPNNQPITRELQDIIDDFAEKGAAGALANL